MFNFKNTATMLVTILALAACGGGGSTSSGSTTPTSPTTPTTPTASTPPIPSAYSSPVTSVPAPTYPADMSNNFQLGIFQQINALRQSIGSGLFAQNLLLDEATQNHWSYVNQNGYANEHTETSGLPGFTGATPTARWLAVGFAYTDANWMEVMYAGTGSPFSASTCVDGWENSVFHQYILFEPALDVGIAAATLTGGPNAGLSTCVVDATSPGPESTSPLGQLPADGTILVYPYSGQTGVATTFNNSFEIPNPAPDLNGTGHPIGISVMTQSHSSPVVVITAATLTPQGGLPVTVRVLVASTNVTGNGVPVTPEPDLLSSFISILPVAPLLPNTIYTVEFQGTVDGTTVSKTSSFTTGS